MLIYSYSSLSLEILKISKGIDEIGSIQWPLFVAVLVAWIMVYVCIIKGIETVSFASIFVIFLVPSFVADGLQ